MDALLKTGQEKSTQLFGLTSQVTEKKSLSLWDIWEILSLLS